MTEPSTAPERVRLSSPADLVAAVPHLVGFRPAESLVAMSLRGGDRARIHLTMRFDLLPAEFDADLAEDVARRLEHDRADQAVLVCFTEAEGDLPRAALVARIETGLLQRGIRVRDAVLVRGGTWRSYLCTDPACCDGPRPLPEVSAQLAAASAYVGRAVLPDRDALVASLRPVTGVARVSMEQATERQSTALVRRLADGATREELAEEGIALFADALRRIAEPDAVPTDDETARLVIALRDVTVRDVVISWTGPDRDDLRTLLHHLVRRAVPPDDAPACAAYAWAMYADGNATVAGIAIERALDSDPSYNLALLLDAALRGQVHPTLLRKASASVGGPVPPTGRRRRRR